MVKEEFSLTKKSVAFKTSTYKNRIITYEELEGNIWDDDSVMTSNAMRLFVKNFRKNFQKTS